MRHSLRSLLLFVLAGSTLTAAAAWQSHLPKAEPSIERLPVLRADSPRYWRGNIHTHSLWSDGDDFPEMIADWYKTHGYHFLALSDHNLLAEGECWIDADDSKGIRAPAVRMYRARFGDFWVERRAGTKHPQVRLKPLAEFRSLLEEPGRFLMIPAEEITHRFAKARSPQRTEPARRPRANRRRKHRRDDRSQSSGCGRAGSTQRTPDARCRQSSQLWLGRAEDIARVADTRFLEVFNAHPSVRNYGDAIHPSCERIWDIVLALRLGKLHLPVVYGLATDDAHGYHAFGVGKVNPGRGWLMIQAPHLSGEAIVRALEAGQFYATTGVTLRDVRRDGDRLLLSIQAEAGVTYRTQFIATMRDAALTSEPRRDRDGRTLPVSRVYSAEVGKVVAKTDALEPAYRLTGQELYVRAKVISTRLHPNPFQKGGVEVAWTQPILP